MVLVEPKHVDDRSHNHFSPLHIRTWGMVLLGESFLGWNQVGGCGTAEGRAALQHQSMSDGRGCVHVCISSVPTWKSLEGPNPSLHRLWVLFLILFYHLNHPHPSQDLKGHS